MANYNGLEGALFAPGSFITGLPAGVQSVIGIGGSLLQVVGILAIVKMVMKKKEPRLQGLSGDIGRCPPGCTPIIRRRRRRR